jgi:hypothetical protein
LLHKHTLNKETKKEGGYNSRYTPVTLRKENRKVKGGKAEERNK